MHRAPEGGQLSLRYPVYAVLSPGPAGAEHLAVVEVDGGDCLLLFRTRELGELYLEQAPGPAAQAPLALHECRGDAELEHLLAQLPESVGHVLWDVTPNARALKLTAVPDLLAALRGGPEAVP